MTGAATREAPAKVILLGEHSVVYGEPAIAAALDRRLRLTVRRGPAEPRHDARRREAIVLAAARAGLDAAELQVDAKSDVPPSCGLGSSAAFSVALVRALADLAGTALSADQTLERAAEVENVFHGRASGVDVAVAARGGVIWFERREVAPLAPAHPVEIVVALSGEARSTAGPVTRLRARYEAAPELYRKTFALAGELAREGREALEGGDWVRLGSLMDLAHGLLNAWGVSTPALERAAACARSAGALGAKLTGAGGGGAVIALSPDRAADVAATLRAEGFQAFVARIPPVTLAGDHPVTNPNLEEDDDAASRRRTA